MTHSLFIYPTDTVWGIGGSIFIEENHTKIAEIKKTSTDKPLSVLFYSIDHLREYFLIPSFLDEVWLNNFFSLGTSLGLPIKLFKEELPTWVHCGSSIIFVRVLPYLFIQEMILKVKAPIFTTSLNITGDAPCVSEEEATLFNQNYAKDCQLITTKELLPSGESSTMVILDEISGEFKISRKGAKVREVEAILKSLKN